MNPDELRRLLKKQPFEPIRLHTTGGDTVDIRHPDMAIATRSMVAVGVGEPDDVADYVVHYGLRHIIKVEPLDGRRRRTRRPGKR